MALNNKNIIVGAARIFLGPAGTLKPAPTAGTRYRSIMLNDDSADQEAAETAAGGSYVPGGFASEWTEIGYTTDGLEVATDPTYTDIEVDQTMDAAKIIKTGMSVSVSTTMVEATLENLLMAWGQPEDTLSVLTDPTEKELVLEGGALGDAPYERGLIAIGNATEAAAGRYGERVYHLYRVLSVEASTHTLSRADAVGIPVTFRALPDDATGRYGTVRDRTGDLTDVTP